MALLITCDDGVQITGDTEEELLERAEAHLREAHPDLVGTIGRDQLRAIAKEV